LDLHKLSSDLDSLDRKLPLKHAPFNEKRINPNESRTRAKHLGREIWGNTAVHGENHVEESDPHVERSKDRRNPGNPAARESPERTLKRRWRRLKKEEVGGNRDTKSYLHPVLPYI
jgi:hypothetical protein